MCGRYNLATDADELAALFDIEPDIDEDFFTNYNASPGQLLPLLLAEQGRRSLQVVEWGLVPNWWSRGAPKPQANAVSETVFEKPYFRSPIRRRRCLVPVNGWYEWRRLNGSVPFNHRMPDGRLFALAGIWDERPASDNSRRGFALLTIYASAQVGEIHNRMPVVLQPRDYAAWLDPSTPQSQVRALLLPYAGLLDVAEVSREVNNVANNGPQLLAAAPAQVGLFG